MTIGFYHVTPAPLAGVIYSGTEVWQKDCEFIEGTHYRLVAPSGKGKSTFMHYVYGLRSDYTGEIKLNGCEAKTLTPDELADLRQTSVSIVYQDLRLFLHLTALQNLQAKAVLYPGDHKTKLHDMGEQLGVRHLFDKRCETLSYGERQRIAIIRAMIQPFRWLLLDEPFSHLDQANSEKAAALIMREITSRKAGCIVTSLGGDHYLPFENQLQL